ncbi:unnamed protein product [Notodromas monacha]|uniref:beta-galactoside alpha-(2,6)-sialyltransferase n=1 Tax=Notodromas monacha TaxID=399045 RepID=A0A7R9BYG0_9CRUS|nr:unnamed protein product [Notodromas monacha]CAG0923691.1 unnamed protein product [Notodromas monacha]
MGRKTNTVRISKRLKRVEEKSLLRELKRFLRRTVSVKKLVLVAAFQVVLVALFRVLVGRSWLQRDVMDSLNRLHHSPDLDEKMRKMRATGETPEMDDIITNKHQAVVRLNDAPTRGFEDFVGSRPATLRFFSNLYTELLVEDAAETFLALDKHQTTLLTWDHCCCGYRHYSYCWEFTAEDSVRKLDLSVFTPGENNREKNSDHRDGIGNYLTRRKMLPSEDYFMFEFDFPWAMWETVQRFYPYGTSKEPPSHSFLAIITALHYCDHVSAYEFIPSDKNPTNSHDFYYESALNQRLEKKLLKPVSQGRVNSGPNGSSSLRAEFHLKLEEMAVLFLLNEANVERVFVDGVAEFRGLRDKSIECP